MGKITLYLPEDLQQMLRETARRTRRHQAELIREALRAYLERQARPRPRSIGLGDDPDLHAEDTEDWLAEHWRPT
jgi:Arc/MetJ-type ribon-helix-helix transcriptional regulator